MSAKGASRQDELQRAISAHTVRNQTVEYSDDFESDEDSILNGTGEELNESNSNAESTKKSVAVESPFSDDDASQKAEDLEDEAADDLTLSFHERKLQQIMLSESENVQDDRKDGEEECLENQNEDDDSKNNEECSAAEEVLCDNSESDHHNDLPMPELWKKSNQEQNKPIPKPRVRKTRNASVSGQKKISTSDLKLEDNGRKSPSVIEVMMATVYEKTTKLEKSTDDSSNETVGIAEGQIKPSEMKEKVLQNGKVSSDSYLSSVHLKKKKKAVPSAKAVSSQYLGTLKVLEDKHEQKNSTQSDKADSLRAAVFQNWLEKKRAFLLELKRAEKKKAEYLRDDTEKAFEKWKERKIEYLREQRKKEKESEKVKKKKEEELAAERKRDSMSAVEKWNEKKEEYIKQKKAEKILERRKQEIQQSKMEERNKKATEEYGRWLEKKERKEQLEKNQKKLQAVCEGEAPSPWSPPGKVTY
ncbi:microtubule-associated protein 9 isoform X2 [Cuculus canorus]|uniref:microtubule-associated protein 9 isoform X2 n=1 Tax=Cuculus canorus TaxID=55661 RepID=UPI0023AA9EED|nr:microtubule-associated protein 9 isoform X2 [Cuculus canorus]